MSNSVIPQLPSYLITKNMKQQNVDVLIIGAGLAGLTAARWLQAHGRTPLILEAAAKVGGRMRTVSWGPGRADAGAQFFTARSSRFQEMTAKWLANGLIFEWSRGWWDGSAEGAAYDGFPRYAASGGMTALMQALAYALPLQTSTPVQAVTAVPHGWQVRGSDGRLYHSRALILTPPVPQSLALLEAGQVPLANPDRAALARITYAPSITGLVWLDGGVNLPEPGALQRPLHPISWMADNQRKRISPEAAVITMHVNPVQSQLWQAAPDEEVQGYLREALRPYLAPNGRIRQIKIMRWPYALPVTLHPERTLLAARLPPLAFAGDAFNGPRVEGAVLSGLAAAAAVGD